MCGADKGYLRHEAFLFHSVNVVIPQKGRNSGRFLPMGAFLETCLLLDGDLRNREGSSPVCLEREASLLILLVHLHCCLPLYLMRRSL